MSKGQKDGIEPIVIKNARVKYASLVKPEKAYDEGDPDLWSLSMFLEPAEASKLVAVGVTSKEDKNGDHYFVAKRSTKNKSGEDVSPPEMVDAAKEPFSKEVGPGSVVNVFVQPFAWTKGKNSGVTLYLKAVQVVKHVASSSASTAFDVVGEPMAKSEAPAMAEGDDDGLPF